MKIIYFVNYFPPNTGAAANNSFKISQYLASNGNKIKILVPGIISKTFQIKDKFKDIDLDNIEVIRSSSLIKFPFNLTISHYENVLKLLYKIKKRFHPNLFLAQYHTFHFASVAGGICAKRMNVPYIIRSHDIFIDLDTLPFWYRNYIRIIYPFVFKSIKCSNFFYVTSSEMKNYLEKFKKFRNVKFKIHYNGIDRSVFYSKPENKLKQKFNCENLILYIGLLSKDLGIQNLIQALREVFKIKKQTHVLIIGEGFYKRYIMEYAKKYGFLKKVHFLKSVPHNEIPYYINNCDIGIGRLTSVESLKYTIPVKCLEYMACKIPFLTTKVSSDLLNKNDVGIKIKDINQTKSLADKLIQLIEDKNLREKLGNNGLKKIELRFTWEKIMKKFLSEIKSIIK